MRPASVTSASLAIGGGIHLAVGVEHGVTTQHGGFFVVVGAAQALLAFTIGRRATTVLLQLALVLSVFVISVWAMTRIGVVLLREPVGATDLICTAFEAVTIAAALVALRPTRALRPATMHLHPVAVLAAVAVTAIVTASTGGSPHDHDHDHGGRGHTECSAPASTHDTSTRLFGDLFSDHHGDAGATCAHDHRARQRDTGRDSLVR
jgi:hypothetical protein